MRLSQYFLSAAAGTLLVGTAAADVKPHPLFTDHIVLQRETDAPVWGTADPGEDVTVSLATADGMAQLQSAKADDKGAWKVSLSTRGAKGTGYKVVIKGKNTVTLTDVAVGDVWLCSGQSNMEWRLNQLTKDDQGKKVAAGAADPLIRLFDVPNRPFPVPQSTFPVQGNSGKWLECKPETVIGFSAVGYFFGREIRRSQNVPVGLIASDWGGTPAQAWTSLGGLKAEPVLANYVKQITDIADNPALVEAKYKADLEKWKAAKEKADAEKKPFAARQPLKPLNGGVNQNTPSALYNGMIAPLVPYAIQGAIWYQGESNAGSAKEYRTLFPAMISDWRKQWGRDLPFFAVQLAPFKGGGGGVDYAELRDAQRFAAVKLKAVGLAVITDVGDENDIHPQNKQPVGERLALAARATVYGEKVEYSGPVYKSHKVEGDKVTITFDHVGGGLQFKGDAAAGFTVCGADKAFRPAKAKIVGDTVEVTSGDVANPVAVRFGWVNFAKPELNFFNKAGLPAVPFRTDDFPLTTK